MTTWLSAEERLLTMDALVSIVGISRSRIYELIAKGDFPRAVKIEGRSLWKHTEAQAWIAARLQSAPRMGASMGSAASPFERAA